MSRAIDADALEELFREVIGGIAKKPEMNGNLEHMVRASAMVIEMIQDAPTIEPQRKKGRWIKKTIKKKIENDYSCSECGRHVSVMRGYDVRLVYPFCHCGADMTEDSKCQNT